MARTREFFAFGLPMSVAGLANFGSAKFDNLVYSHHFGEAGVRRPTGEIFVNRDSDPENRDDGDARRRELCCLHKVEKDPHAATTAHRARLDPTA